MMRDEKTAPLVNLTPQKVPQDIYEAVAKRVKEIVDSNVDAYEDGHLAQMWLNCGIDRKVVKRNVMSYFYSSNAYGMAKQQREELMQELADKVESGKLKKHPFEGESDAAAKYMADQYT
jgi:DNA-directed RNA polymerase